MTSIALATLLLVPTGGKALVTVHAADAKAAAGSAAVEARVDVTVAQGFHVQANPASEDYLIPTRLTLSGAKIDKLVYPPGKPFQLAGTGKSIAVYDGTFPIQARISTAGLKPGRYEVKGELEYQACDHRSCRPPTTAPVSLTVEIEKK